MIKVLMVCTGNICRSPTAEGVLRARLLAAGLDRRVMVASAGTHDYHIGEAADARTIAAAARRGIDLSAHVARQVTGADCIEFDFVLALDRGHLQDLKARRPAKAKVELALLMDYAPGHPLREVPDPYFSDRVAFEQVLDLSEAACAGLLNRLAARLDG
ncbi:MAG: low molecular weight phosphotyrosine protein phosphatase [Alphaproteobacteria bacterium]|nr:low molecular weight phosphotyrosine protein phosphatase [Alphaproteobacteria bacterium]